MGKSVSEFLVELQSQIQEFMIMLMITLMLNNRGTQISIIREQLTDIFWLANRSLFWPLILQINFWVDGKDRGQLCL